jgi:hypothetical protein
MARNSLRHSESLPTQLDPIVLNYLLSKQEDHMAKKKKQVEETEDTGVKNKVFRKYPMATTSSRSTRQSSTTPSLPAAYRSRGR